MDFHYKFQVKARQSCYILLAAFCVYSTPQYMYLSFQAGVRTQYFGIPLVNQRTVISCEIVTNLRSRKSHR